MCNDIRQSCLMYKYFCVYRTELVFADQFSVSYIVNHQVRLTKGIELGNLRCLIIGGSRTSPIYRQKLIERWPDSSVSSD